MGDCPWFPWSLPGFSALQKGVAPRTGLPQRGHWGEGEAAAPPTQVENLCYRERPAGMGMPALQWQGQAPAQHNAQGCRLKPAVPRNGQAIRRWTRMGRPEDGAPTERALGGGGGGCAAYTG